MDEQWGAQIAEDGDCLGGALVRIRRDPDVEGFAGGDRGVESADGFLEGRLGVEVVMVEDVDVVDTKTPQALIEAGEKILPRSEVAIGARPHVPPGFGGDDKFVPVVAKVLTENPPEVGLGAAIRGSVVVGQVEMGDSQIEGSPQDGALGFEWSVVTKVLPQPERHRRQEQATTTTTAIGHGLVTIFSGDVGGHLALLCCSSAWATTVRSLSPNPRPTTSSHSSAKAASAPKRSRPASSRARCTSLSASERANWAE